MRRVVPWVVVAAVALGACSPDESPDRRPATQTGPIEVRDPAVAALLAESLPPGATGSLVAAQEGELVHCAGFDAETTCDTAYDVMSMTKQFTAAAVLKLQMMGLVRVDDPIRTFLRDVPADKRSITLHQLLTHTSGLGEAVGGDYAPVTRQEMLDAALESALVTRPGSAYHYSNVGYSILAAIVEEVSGSGYEEFLAEHLFTPAGMSDTGYLLPQWAPGQVAFEYDASGRSQGRPVDHPWAADGPYWNLRGNGGLLSTARDMYRWHLALEGDEILDERAKQQLFAPAVSEGPGTRSFYGYGWVVQETEHGPVVGHDGGNSWSYGEIVRLLDERVMVFWVTNRYRDRAAGWDLSRLAPTVTGGVVQQLLASP